MIADLTAVRDNSQSRVPVLTHAHIVKGTWWIAATLIAIVAGGGLTKYTNNRRTATQSPTGRTVVVATIKNPTGRTDLDNVVTTAVAVQLDRSPVLHPVSQQRIADALNALGVPADAKLEPRLASKVCQQLGSRAAIDGDLEATATGYEMNLGAWDCSSGRRIASAKLDTTDPNQVLRMIWQAAADLRLALGESQESVRDIDISGEVTTSSFEAFRKYEEGDALHDKGDDAASVAFFQRSIELDPSFATAYESLGHAYRWLNAYQLSANAFAQAYRLRDRTNGAERLWIETIYYEVVTGEMFKALDTATRWSHLYPGDPRPHNILGTAYTQLGDYPKAISELRHTLAVNERSSLPYSNLGWALFNAGRIEEARALLGRAAAQKLDDVPRIHRLKFALAMVTHDESAMATQEAWANTTAEEMSALWM